MSPTPPFPHTLPNIQRDFVEWHRGRPTFALWAIDLDLPEVRARQRAAAAHLGALLLQPYRRQPHVTLGLCGFPSVAPQAADDFGGARFAAQLGALRALRPPPFDVEIGALDSFASAPFLRVEAACGSLARLHACLGDGPMDPPAADYVPHVTVGLYGGAWPRREVAARLAALAAPGPLRLQVERISLLGYAAADIGGPLRRLADYDLRDGRLRWLPAGAALASCLHTAESPACANPGAPL